jgi:hypothetical protein
MVLLRTVGVVRVPQAVGLWPRDILSCHDTTNACPWRRLCPEGMWLLLLALWNQEYYVGARTAEALTVRTPPAPPMSVLLLVLVDTALLPWSSTKLHSSSSCSGCVWPEPSASCFGCTRIVFTCTRFFLYAGWAH